MTGDSWTTFFLLCGFLSVVFFYFSGKFDEKKRDGVCVALMAGGIFFLICLSVCSFYAFQNGSPLTQISPGVYKIGFVYQAGGNVSIGIEKPKRSSYEKTEMLFLYQFPKKDFEGRIEPQAKKLTTYKLVTGEGTFDRYKLE